MPQPIDADGRSVTAASLIHETGHALGLGDLYDLNAKAGPPGGVGGWDMMDSTEGDHNALSKIMLGWIVPKVVSSGSEVVTLRPSSRYPDAAIVMPRYSLAAPRREFFLVQARDHSGNDQVARYANGGLGLQIWHVDAVDGVDWGEFVYNNTTTRHKLLRLMEADGREDIENLREDTSGADLYRTGQSFGPATKPSSRPYLGTRSGVSVTDISVGADAVTCTLTAGSNDLDLKAPVSRAVLSYNRSTRLVRFNVKVSDAHRAWTRVRIGSKWERWDGIPREWSSGPGKTISFYSCDRAGNVERIKHVHIGGRATR